MSVFGGRSADVKQVLGGVIYQALISPTTMQLFIFFRLFSRASPPFNKGFVIKGNSSSEKTSYKVRKTLNVPPNGDFINNSTYNYNTKVKTRQVSFSQNREKQAG